MKYIKTFEQFINENLDSSDLNEGIKFSDVHKLAKEFLNATKSKFKVSDSKIMKSKSPTYKGMKKTKVTSYHVQLVVPENKLDSIREFIKDFKEKHKEEIETTGLSFSPSAEIEGKKQLWPADNKTFFDI